MLSRGTMPHVENRLGERRKAQESAGRDPDSDQGRCLSQSLRHETSATCALPGAAVARAYAAPPEPPGVPPEKQPPRGVLQRRRQLRAHPKGLRRAPTLHQTTGSPPKVPCSTGVLDRHRADPRSRQRCRCREPARWPKPRHRRATVKSPLPQVSRAPTRPPEGVRPGKGILATREREN